LFWRNWYSYPVEVNNFHLIIYQRHQGIFARHRDLLAPYVGKISDELVNPSIPGHIQVLIKQGETFGLSAEEMIDCEVLPECRALTEFARGLVYEGSMIEWWARSLNEEMFGHWSRRWREALLAKYKFEDPALHYFQVHEEADLHEHLEGPYRTGSRGTGPAGVPSIAASPMPILSGSFITAFTNGPEIWGISDRLQRISSL
jgi:hypothetical protein